MSHNSPSDGLFKNKAHSSRLVLLCFTDLPYRNVYPVAGTCHTHKNAACRDVHTVSRGPEMEAQTCPRGSFKLSHETRRTNKNLTSAACNLSPETLKWKPKTDLWDALPVAKTLALTHFMNEHPTPHVLMTSVARHLHTWKVGLNLSFGTCFLSTEKPPTRSGPPTHFR
jgi:hypothetical protein